MKTSNRIFLLVFMLMGFFILTAYFNSGEKESQDSEKITNLVKPDAEEDLVVLWTSGDRDVALKMVFMYTYNAKARGWMENITFIVWGPSAKLLSDDDELQDYIKKFVEAGVVLEACKACSDSYGVSDKLEELGVDVKYMGVPLTNYIKEGKKILTF